MLYGIFIGLLITLTFIWQLVLNCILRHRKEILDRLDEIQSHEIAGLEELNLPFSERVFKPFTKKVSKLMNKLTPEGFRKSMDQKLNAAGNPFKSGLTGWIIFRSFCLTVIPAAVLLILITTDASFSEIIIFGGGAAAFGIFYPDMYLKSKLKRRQKEIQKTLPDVLDLITVSVEAGMAFDAALSKVGDKMPGELSKLFNHALQEIKMGKPRREALKNMAEETGIHDLISFISAIIQADQLGVSIASVLRIQSAQIREKRKQRIQEAAMKAPVKMLIPLVIFVFPTIFIILMGPAIIIAIEMFGK